MTTTAAGAPAPPAEGRMWDRALSYWWMSYRRTWRGTLFSGFLSPLFFLLSMGFLLGSLVDRSNGGGVGGVSYLAFVAPGVLAAQAMQTAIGESTWSVLGAVKWQRQYHAMLAGPLGVTDVLVGHLAYVAIRVSITSAVFVLVAGVLGAFESWWVLAALPVALLTGMAFAVPTFAFSARTEADGGFNVLFRFIVMPLFLFSGTFFPVSQLPAVLQPIAYVTPLWHGVDACRDLALGQATVLGVLGHVAYLLLWVVVGFAVARWSFRSKLVV
jgi:lipooligosaccharide transport system permease protein